MNTAIYTFMAQTDNASASACLTLALAKAEPPHAEAIAHALLERAGAGQAGLIQYFHRLPPGARDAVVQKIAPIYEPLRQAARASDMQTRVNAADIIGAAQAMDLVSVLPVGLMDSSALVQEAAASALRHLADQFLATFVETDGNAPSARGDDRTTRQPEEIDRCLRALLAAIQDGLHSYPSHRRPEVLEAAMWFAGQTERVLQAHVLTGDATCLDALTELLRSHVHPRMAEFTYLALSWSSMRHATAEMLSQVTDEPFLRQLFASSEYLGRSTVRHGLAEIRRLAWLEKNPQGVQQLPHECQLGALKFIASTSIDPALKLMALQDAVLLGERPLQRAAIDALLTIESDESTQILRQVLGWDDVEFSELCLIELIRRNPADLPTIVVQQLASLSPRVRRIAAQHVSLYGFQRYWKAFDSMTGDARINVGRAMLKIVPNFVQQLASHLSSAEPAAVIRALHSANDLDLVSQLYVPIAKLTDHPDPTVRKLAIQATPPVETEADAAPPAENPEPEIVPTPPASAAAPGSKIEQLQEGITSNDAETRAAATQRLLDTMIVPATDMLKAMLNDDDPQRRMCALSLIEQTGQVDLIATVLRMTRSDAEPWLRSQAQSVAQQLYGALQRVTVPVEQAP